MMRSVRMLSLCAVLATSGCVVSPPPPTPSGSVADIQICDRVAAGEGALWATFVTSAYSGPGKDSVRSGIAKIDPQSGRVLTTLGAAIDGVITDMVVGQGAIWVATRGSPGKIHKIDPSTGQLVASVQLPGRVFMVRHELRLAVGDGAVWARNWLGGSDLYRLDPSTAQLAATIEYRGPLPVASKQGAVLVGTPQGLARLDPRTDSLVDSTPWREGWGMLEAASTAAVWGRTRKAEQLLSRIDLKTGEVMGVAVPGPVWKVFGAGENNVWVGFIRERKPWIAEIDAASGGLRQELPMPWNSPHWYAQAAVSGDDLWLCTSTGKVERFASSR